jgi:hypothetical protein
MKVCFNGCSLTAGEGVSHDQNYPSLIASHSWHVSNISEIGSSNYRIFMRSIKASLSGQYDIIITQWSALNRMWLSPGPDSEFCSNDRKFSDFRYRDLYLDNNSINNFRNTLLLIIHDYKNIFELVNYCDILNNISKLTQTRVVFVNGLLPWTPDLVLPLPTNLNNGLSEYTKSILDFHNRDDNEIIELFTQLKNKFAELDQTLWVNLFNSFAKDKIDYGTDSLHPGPQSHHRMAKKITDYLDI